ncbi:hypothetical protein ACMFMG_011819 [Clarireedia jacksonii]
MVGKRKAQDSLSQNPHTVKARKRAEALENDPIRGQIEKAKARDQSAVTYAKSQLKKTQEYIDASEDAQHQMLVDCDAEVRHRREVKGKDWKTLATSLGWGDHGGQYAVEDDNNTAWEDIEYEEEFASAYETSWRNDEIFNGEHGYKTKTEAELDKEKEDTKKQVATRKVLTKLGIFWRWQNIWKNARNTLFKKYSQLHDAEGAYVVFKRQEIKKGLERARIRFQLKKRQRKLAKTSPKFQFLSNKLRLLKREDKKAVKKALKWISPGTFFTASEKAFWRALVVSLVDNSFDDGWVDLPGPASWWPESTEEIDNMDFLVPENDREQYINAIKLVYTKEMNLELWDNWMMVLPSNSNLQVLADTQANMKRIKSFYD